MKIEEYIYYFFLNKKKKMSTFEIILQFYSYSKIFEVEELDSFKSRWSKPKKPWRTKVMRNARKEANPWCEARRINEKLVFTRTTSF